MDSCWSCLVVIEKGVKLCPLCGADQTPLPETPAGEAAKPQTLNSVMLRWVVPGVAILCFLVVAVWYSTMRKHDEDSPAPAEAAAIKALVSIRVALSQYALSAGDKYPSTLELLGDHAAAPLQTARNQGYAMIYKPILSKGDGTINGFTLLARPEKISCRNFYIDQSGILRATQERRPARIDDPPI